MSTALHHHYHAEPRPQLWVTPREQHTGFGIEPTMHACCSEHVQARFCSSFTGIRRDRRRRHRAMSQTHSDSYGTWWRDTSQSLLAYVTEGQLMRPVL